MAPREILSPAVARNGHLSLHVVISGAGRHQLSSLYRLQSARTFCESNSIANISPHAATISVPDWLAEQNSPTFGAIPEFRHDLARPAMDQQTTRCYLLDIWAPPDTPPRRVRVEALLKTGTWLVAPLEVRVLATCYTRCAVTTGLQKMSRHWTSLRAPRRRSSCSDTSPGCRSNCPASMLRVRDMIQRNAAEDMLLARSFEHRAAVSGTQPIVVVAFRLSWAGRGMVSQGSRFPVPV